VDARASKIITRTSLIAFFASAIILAVKAAAYWQTGSKVILSDAMEGMVHLLASGFTVFLIRLSVKPPDKEHPYGHGKSEFLSATFEGGLITLAGIGTIFISIESLISGPTIRAIDFGLILVVICGIANIALALFLLSIGKKYRSEAITASGHHLVSDFVTSVGALLSLLAVELTGYVPLDPILACVFGSYLCFTGIRIVKRALNGLLDARDEAAYQAFIESANKVIEPGIIKIHRLRILRSGRFNVVDSHVVVPEFWTIEEAHEKVNIFENRIVEDFGVESEIHFHLDPCRRKFCRECDLANCPVRKEPFEKRMKYTVEEAESIV